MSDVCGLESYE